MARPASIFSREKLFRPPRISASGCAHSRSRRTTCRNYVQGGRVLIRHQAVALRLAEMATAIEATRALTARAAEAVDAKAPEADALCNMAKMFASEQILKVAHHAVELHGGNGMMLDFGVEKLYRDASIFLHMDATTDISRMKIVKSMFPHTAGKYAGPEA